MRPRRMVATYPWRYRTAAFPQTAAEYGAATDAESKATAEVIEILHTAVSGSWEPEVIEARIANLKSAKKKFPAMSLLIDNRINVLQGKLSAARRSQSRLGAWHALGQTGIVVAIIAGLGVAGLAVASTVAVSRRREHARSQRAAGARLATMTAKNGRRSKRSKRAQRRRA